MQEMIFAANAKYTDEYPDGRAFVDYNEYIKLVIVDDFCDDDEYIQVSYKPHITSWTISIGW